MHRSFTLAMIRFRNKILSISSLVILLTNQIVFTSALAQTQKPVTCSAWEGVRGDVNALGGVLGCGPEFTTEECAKNSGYGSKVELVGAAAGAMAGANIGERVPEVCGSNASAGRPSCDVEVKKVANKIADILRKSVKIRQATLGVELRMKLAKDNHHLVPIVDLVKTTFGKNGKPTPKELAGFNQKLKPHGIQWNAQGQCVGKIETCKKVWLLASPGSSAEAEEQFAANADSLAAFYPSEPSVSDYQNAIKDSKSLIGRVEKGMVKNEEALSELYSRAFENADASSKKSLSETGNYIASVFRNTSKPIVPKGSSALLAKGSALFGKIPGLFKTILPYGLGALLGIAQGSNRTEQAALVMAAMAPIHVTLLAKNSQTTLGCAEVTSRYAPQVLKDGVCKPELEMTDKIIDFLTLDPDDQAAEVCLYPSLAKTLTDLSQRYFPRGMTLTCSSNEVVVSTPEMKDTKSFYGKFSFDSTGRISSAFVGAASIGGDVLDYNLVFKEGSVSSGGFRKSGAQVKIGPGIPTETVALIGRDFATRQVIALGGQDCCRADKADMADKAEKTENAGSPKDSCSRFSSVKNAPPHLPADPPASSKGSGRG